jgi:hypothetical protein
MEELLSAVMPYMGAIACGTLIAATVGKILVTAFDDIWTDHKLEKPKLADTIVALVMGLGGALGGWAWEHAGTDGNAVRGALVGFGASSFTSYVVSWVLRKFEGAK